MAASLLLLLGACAGSNGSNQGVSTHEARSSGWQVETSSLSSDRQQFITQVAARYAIPPGFVKQMLDEAQINQRVIELMSPKTIAKVKQHWPTYRKRFVEPIRIRKGTDFWVENRTTLEQAERIYGIPAAVLVSIIGVETVYGGQLGTFNIRDALYSLGFYHPDSSRPEKARMFRNQLAALIELDHKGHFDGRNSLGSFAGASGLPQFMPISILHYAVDADKSGKIDLRNSPKDAIYSVANFLVKHGWQSDLPIFAPVTLPAHVASLVDGDLEVDSTWVQLLAKGARSRVSHAAWQQGLSLGVIDLKDEVNGRTEYRTATRNFFAITKYNRSYFYATAVADLATELALKQQQSGYKASLP